jgi:hypothetical protein
MHKCTQPHQPVGTRLGGSAPRVVAARAVFTTDERVPFRDRARIKKNDRSFLEIPRIKSMQVRRVARIARPQRLPDHH